MSDTFSMSPQKRDLVWEAREALRGHVRCAVVDAAGELHTSVERGVRPMLLWLRDDPDLLRGATIADKVVGRAAALLAIYGGASHVYGDIMSESAVREFDRAGVRHSATLVTEGIMNRRGDGICPMERLCAGASSPEEAYLRMRKKVLEDEQ